MPCASCRSCAAPVDLLFVDANKEDYLDYLRAVEPRLVKGALVVADNTGIFRREVKGYLDRVRTAPWESREYDFGSDCMEASIFRGQPT
jgi:predicted O-methyltransferase YrrM